MAIRILEFIREHIIAIGMFAIGLFTLRSIIEKEQSSSEARQQLEKAIKSNMDEPLTLHPHVDLASCAGCGACTQVCPEGDILRLIDNKAVLVSPTKCVGHGECEVACPTNAISLVFGTKTRGMEIPRVTGNYETNMPGLYIAGELGGMGLIRNAIKQGAAAARHAVTHLGPGNTDYDILIVGAGPAGLAAGLCAVEAGKKYLCIDQNSLGGTIFHYPRQKVVMSHPLDLPMFGKKKFESSKVSKEQLLGYFDEVRQRAKLKVDAGVKLETVQPEDTHFRAVITGREVTAKKVILAMGVRGSPRKLGVPGEETSKVTYSLLDPEQYQGRDVLVVGGGNAGVEAAQMLANPKWRNKVHLLVRGKNFDRCNEENLNIIQKMQAKGHLEIWTESSITEIFPDRVSIKRATGTDELKNDFVFVFAGAEMPHKFLMSLGVQITKKFGERLAGA